MATWQLIVVLLAWLEPASDSVSTHQAFHTEREDFHWQSPSHCPNEEQQWVKLAPSLRVQDRSTELRVDVEIWQSGEGHLARVRLETDEKNSERQIEGADCGSLSDAVILVIRAVLDSELSEWVEPGATRVKEKRENRTEEKTEAEPGTPHSLSPSRLERASGEADVETNAPTVPRSQTTTDSNTAPLTGFFLQASTSAEFEALPQIAPAFAFGAGYGFGLWSVEAEGKYVLRQSHTPLNEQGGQFSIFGGSLGLCRKVNLGGRAVSNLSNEKMWQFQGCAAFEAGLIQGQGIGLIDPQSSVRPRLGVRLEPRLRWQAHRHFALFVGVGGTLLLLRPVFEATGIGTVFHAPLGTFSLRLGFEFRV